FEVGDWLCRAVARDRDQVHRDGTGGFERPRRVEVEDPTVLHDLEQGFEISAPLRREPDRDGICAGNDVGRIRQLLEFVGTLENQAVHFEVLHRHDPVLQRLDTQAAAAHWGNPGAGEQRTEPRIPGHESLPDCGWGLDWIALAIGPTTAENFAKAAPTFLEFF